MVSDDKNEEIPAVKIEGPYCSFCGRAKHQYKTLINGPNVYICEDCIIVSYDIIKDRLGSDFVTNYMKVR